ncbi:hypothetical protein VST7929_00310 [Vibrio stylophorae]|uniref:Polymerase nucleotidyl transferase domain-containing protein n=1 Tax=Vibrio stylophorae TaxID=659351 RepID=A0ABM8ZQB1_9VIBR|nr:nucleotidyltransferase domain-containing protein [Vibrio stylophorae]CAH0532480.1 hypothetical protein VST7929_00310 [Vibrio stylophorae]
MKYPSTLPHQHQQLLEQILAQFSQDARLVGIAAGGSYASNHMDQFSDLDLIIAIDPEHYAAVMAQRFQLIEKIPGCVSAFTGEHVGEPRLVIALYAPHAIHVDFKFVSLSDAAQRVDDAKILWQRDEQLTKMYDMQAPCYPQPNAQWIEDRFWIWLHYGATKIGRGEYFEAMEFLSFLRTTVLSPLALRQHNLTPSGVRTIEMRLPQFAEQLKATIAVPEPRSLLQAFEQTVALYQTLRQQESVQRHAEAEQLALSYLAQIKATVQSNPYA